MENSSFLYSKSSKKKLISLFIPQAVSIPSFPACFLILYFESLAAVVVYLDTAKMAEGGNVRLMRSVKGRSSGVGLGGVEA